MKPLETHLGIIGNFGIWETKLEIWGVGEENPNKKRFWGNQWEFFKKSDEKSIDC